MFWRKQKRAINGFHPLHRDLTLTRRLQATGWPADWDALLGSLAQHERLIRRSKWVLPPRMTRVVVPLLRCAAADVAPDKTLSLTVDLSGPESPQKAWYQQPVAKKGRIRGGVEKYYYDQWLRLHAELRDGGTLDVTIVDVLRVRKLRKRSRSGKTKFKTKRKGKQRITVRRVLPKGVTGTRPGSRPSRGVVTTINAGKRFVVRAMLKSPIRQNPVAEHQDLFTALAEPFRWTPPTSRNARSSA